MKYIYIPSKMSSKNNYNNNKNLKNLKNKNNNTSKTNKINKTNGTNKENTNVDDEYLREDLVAEFTNNVMRNAYQYNKNFDEICKYVLKMVRSQSNQKDREEDENKINDMVFVISNINNLLVTIITYLGNNYIFAGMEKSLCEYLNDYEESHSDDDNDTDEEECDGCEGDCYYCGVSNIDIR